MYTKCLCCENCGRKYDHNEWPRVCTSCGHIRYLNAVSAAMAMVPVDNSLLYIKRAIEPKKGLWGMPGGFTDFKETFEENAARELYEETGLDIDSSDFEIFGRSWKSNAGHSLIFCLAKVKPYKWSDLKNKLNIDTAEVYEAAPFNPDKMESAFPIHFEVYKQWITKK